MVAGLANNVFEKLLVSATYIMRPYQSSVAANQPPAGVTVGAVNFIPPTKDQAGEVSAQISVDPAYAYSPADHRGGILLLDGEGRALYLNYLDNLTMGSDAQGNLESIRLELPAGSTLPEKLEAVIMLDVFPEYWQILK